jgi:hypothetical protein
VTDARVPQIDAGRADLEPEGQPLAAPAETHADPRADERRQRRPVADAGRALEGPQVVVEHVASDGAREVAC